MRQDRRFRMACALTGLAMIGLMWGSVCSAQQQGDPADAGRGGQGRSGDGAGGGTDPSGNPIN